MCVDVYLFQSERGRAQSVTRCHRALADCAARGGVARRTQSHPEIVARSDKCEGHSRTLGAAVPTSASGMAKRADCDKPAHRSHQALAAGTRCGRCRPVSERTRAAAEGPFAFNRRTPRPLADPRANEVRYRVAATDAAYVPRDNCTSHPCGGGARRPHIQRKSQERVRRHHAMTLQRGS